MHVGAIITVSRPFFSLAGESSSSEVPPIANWDALGASVLDRMVDRLRISGVSEISILHQNHASARPDSGAELIKSDPEWKNIASQYLGYGLKSLLRLRIGAYVELDVADFLRFHRGQSSPVTQAYDRQGELDLLAVDARHLHNGERWLHRNWKARARYPFDGYANRLGNAQDFRQLVKDALLGRAGIRPIGREIATNVWVNEGARVDESTRIVGPAYIGKNSHIHSRCTISGASSIEQGCEIDCGTIVDDSCILPGTYLGMALNVRSAVASKHTLFHLGRNLQLQFHDRRIIGGMIWPRRLLHQARSYLPVITPTSLNAHGQPADCDRHL